jgi:L-asparaginase II
MVGGTGRVDTRVMQAFGERVCCKVGAEGMYCVALPDEGLGIAIKMDDGNTARAVEVAMAALLRRFVPAKSDAEAALLAELSNVTLRNWRGIEVGRLAAHETLSQAKNRPPM